MFFPSCSQQPTQEEISSEIIESTPDAIAPPEIPPVLPTEEIIQGTISIRHSWDETKAPTLAAIIKIFQSYYPDVLFDVLSVPADTLFDYFTTESSMGYGATILLGPAEWGPSLSELGIIADLTDVLDDEILNNLNPAAVKSGYIQDKLLSLPYSISGVVLFRNAELITIQPNTFDELVSLAQSTTRGSTIGAYLERSFFYSGAHLLGLGGQIIDTNQLPGFNNGAGVAWLQLLQDFELAGPVCYFSDDDLERFKQGQVGWIIDGTWNLNELTNAIGIENLAVDPWPTADGGTMSGFVQSENIYLNSKTDPSTQQAAVKFMQFFISPEAQSRLTDIGEIPANRQVFVSDKETQALINQVISALNGGSAYPVETEMDAFSLNLDLALRAFFDENMTAEQVLQSAQDSILAELEKANPTASP